MVSGSLGLGQASFDLEAWSLFPDGVYEKEGEGAHWLGVLMKHSFSRSSELSLRTLSRRCDTITFLYSLQVSVWSEASSVSEGLLGVHLILLCKCEEDGW